jgi:hypothetical protein
MTASTVLGSRMARANPCKAPRLILIPCLIALFSSSNSAKRQRVNSTVTSAFPISTLPVTPDRPTTDMANGYRTSHTVPPSTTPSPSMTSASAADSEGRPAVTIAMLRALTQNVKRKYGTTPTSTPTSTPMKG